MGSGWPLVMSQILFEELWLNMLIRHLDLSFTQRQHFCEKKRAALPNRLYWSSHAMPVETG